MHNLYHKLSSPKSGHSTAAGHRANCPSNCIFSRLLCFQKWTCQSESKIRLCFAGSPFYFRITTYYTWKWVECPAKQSYFFYSFLPQFYVLLQLRKSEKNCAWILNWKYCRPLLFNVCQRSNLRCYDWLYNLPLLSKVCQRSNLCCCDWLYHRPLLFNVCKNNNSCNCVLLYCLSVMFNFLFSIYYFN